MRLWKSEGKELEPEDEEVNEYNACPTDFNMLEVDIQIIPSLLATFLTAFLT